MAEQIITQEYLQTIFEYKDGHLFWKIKPAKKINIGQKAGCICPDGYVCINFNKKRYQAHRLIYIYHHNFIENEIDHINTIRNDNRIENLRTATRSQNAYNQTVPKNSTTGIKGISWNKREKKWQVSLKINGHKKSFGYYNDIDYAVFINNAMRHKYHKEYYRT